MHKKVGLTADAFPVFDKVSVNGPETADVFKLLKTAPWHDERGDAHEIAWNYEKFLVDAEGIPLKRYASDEDPRVAEADIRSLLGLA